jgi:hypothetical protein
MVCNWFEENCRADWDEADELFSRGKITAKHYPKLFRPDELILNPRKENEGIVWVYKSRTYPWKDDKDAKIDMLRWDYNGAFRKNEVTMVICNTEKDYGDISERDGEVDITSLIFYPARFAGPDVLRKLVARGNKFWGCRRKKLISYTEPVPEFAERGGATAVGRSVAPSSVRAHISFGVDARGADACTYQVEHRLMVDYNFFRRLHPRKPMFSNMTDDLGTEAMNKEQPPDDDFLAMLPPLIHAFDFSTKAWRMQDRVPAPSVERRVDIFLQG